MRPINRTNKFNPNGTPVEHNPWGDAKPHLIAEIGDYCSYCGKHLTRSALAIEHIVDKNTHPQFKYHWNNFLLACVNCNSTKSTKDTTALNPFMPHTDNLLCYIEILQGGTIQIKNGVNGINLQRSQTFINLVGLDRHPGHPDLTDKDDRWEYRLEAYDLAERQLQKYTSNPATTDIENIVTLASKTGFFTVWFTIFDAYNNVKDALIDAYTGTNRARFNAQNNFQPI